MTSNEYPLHKLRSCPLAKPRKIKIDASAHVPGCRLKKRETDERFVSNTYVVPKECDDGYGLGLAVSKILYGGLRGVKVAEKRRYYDDWWNGTKSGNIDLELAPSKDLKDALIKYKTIT